MITEEQLHEELRSGKHNGKTISSWGHSIDALWQCQAFQFNNETKRWQLEELNVLTNRASGHEIHRSHDIR